MIKEILYKWLGLEALPCNTCEVLRAQLDESNRERRELLSRLLERDKPEPLVQNPKEEMKPIGTRFVPWRVRQQMLEEEDRHKAHLLRVKEAEMKVDAKVEELEKELGIPTDASKE